jgi:hypothetical protein
MDKAAYQAVAMISTPSLSLASSKFDGSGFNCKSSTGPNVIGLATDNGTVNVSASNHADRRCILLKR